MGGVGGGVKAEGRNERELKRSVEKDARQKCCRFFLYFLLQAWRDD